METTLTLQDSEPYPESSSKFEFNSVNLLKSNYKNNVDKTYADASLKSVFGMRQHLKFSGFVRTSQASVVLKLAVFAISLALIF